MMRARTRWWQQKTARHTIRWIIVHLLLVLLVVAMVGPFIYAFSSSFKSENTLISIPPRLMPEEPTLDNYIYILTKLPFVTWFLNSTFVAAGVTVLNVLICALAAYPLAKKQFFGRDPLFAFMLSTVTIPPSLLLIPRFLITHKLQLVNTRAGLIIPAVGGVMGVFLLRQFMRTLPTELEDAARIDGCSEIGVFWRIVLPLSAPAMGTLGIMSSTGSWNALIWPVVILNDKAKYTLPLGLALLRSEFIVNYGITSATAFLSVIPLLVVFLFLQRYFMAGLTVGALKG